MLIHSNVHGDDEGSVEVGEDVPFCKKDGGMILEQNNGETIRRYKGDNHESQGG